MAAGGSKCDVFGRIVDIGDPFSADGVRLLTSEFGREDFLVQQVASQYQQNVNRLWEVGSPKTYFVAGRTQGQMQIRRVIGPNRGVFHQFIEKYGNVCNIQGNHITLALVAECANCESDVQPKASVKLSGCVVTSVAYSVAAVDMIINEDLTLLFAKQEKDAAGGSSA